MALSGEGHSLGDVLFLSVRCRGSHYVPKELLDPYPHLMVLPGICIFLLVLG